MEQLLEGLGQAITKAMQSQPLQAPPQANIRHAQLQAIRCFSGATPTSPAANATTTIGSNSNSPTHTSSVANALNYIA